jgi:hypothetical protein
LGKQHIGTLAPGKHADLVVIHGDPSSKINDIENVEILFKDEVGYDSAKLIESVPGQVGPLKPCVSNPAVTTCCAGSGCRSDRWSKGIPGGLASSKISHQ